MGEDAPADYEVRGLKKTREIVWVLKRNARIEYNGQPAILGNVIDITRRKEMEAALKESERKLRFLSSHLMTVQENERRRLSVELHDELGQALLAIKLQVRAIERKLREGQKTLKKDCDHTLGYIDQTIENVRRISQDLSPVVLEHLGLTAALRRLAEEFLEYHEVERSIDIDEIDSLFPREKEIIVYRIIQEAFTNISKHALASAVSLAIKKCDGVVTFHVEDKGSGFDVGQVWTKGMSKRGLGLAAMDQRIRMLGGIPALWSRRGVGTRISFSVPISGEGSL
jgi:signal transduction histidine kinase